MFKIWGYSLAMALVFCLSIYLSSCKKEDDTILDSNGVAIKLPHLWNTSLTNTTNIVDVVVATPIIYDDGKLLMGANKGSERIIFSMNSSDGSINWEWGDVLGLLNNPSYKDPIILYTESYYQNSGRIFFTYSTSSYCIDLVTGQTLWKYKSFKSRYDSNGGIDDTYFTAGGNYEPIDGQKIYFGDMQSSAEEQLLIIPEYTIVDNAPVNARGIISRITPFKNGGDTFIAFGMENPSKDFTLEGLGLTELNLYNMTTGEYVYKKVVVNPNKETRVAAWITYQSPNLYFQSSNYIHGYEAMTGKELWRTFLGSAPLTSRMLLADNKLFSACEDRFLYCVDAYTGSLLWKTQNTGTCSELSYLNGVVYYLGGGDGLLHAVDANTGNHLWKIQSPDLKVNTGAWFYGVCVAVPGKNGAKGVVVATTGLNAYGYEAIR